MKPTEFLQKLSAFPITDDQRNRIRMAKLSADLDDLPRVRDAGNVVEGEGIDLPWQVMHNGVKVVRDGYGGAWTTELVKQTRGIHEPQEEKVFHQILEALREIVDGPGVMVELGAYWSFYSLWFRSVFPESRCVLVEPDPEYRKIGEINFFLNDEEGEYLDACVGPVDRDRIEFRCETNDIPRLCRQISVDTLLDEFSVAKVDLLLADIQGAETGMLEGLEKSVSEGRVRALFVSTHSEEISGDFLTHRRCLEKLKSLGAHIVAEHTIEESFSGDGLIVATFDPNLKITVPISRNRASDSLFGDLSFRCDQLSQELKERARESVANKLALVAAQDQIAEGMRNSTCCREWKKKRELNAKRKQLQSAEAKAAKLVKQGKVESISEASLNLYVRVSESVSAESIRESLALDEKRMSDLPGLLKRAEGLPKKGVFLDLGAAHGFRSMWMLKRGGAEKAVAIEGSGRQFAALSGNVSRNRLQDSIVPLRDRIGVMESGLAGVESGSTQSDSGTEPDRQLVTLGRAFRSIPKKWCEPIALCWIEGPGLELQFLLGASAVFVRERCPVVISVSPKLRSSGSTHEEFILAAQALFDSFLILDSENPEWREISDLRSAVEPGHDLKKSVALVFHP